MKMKSLINQYEISETPHINRRISSLVHRTLQNGVWAVDSETSKSDIDAEDLCHVTPIRKLVPCLILVNFSCNDNVFLMEKNL
jgi:hypothetical protein